MAWSDAARKAALEARRRHGAIRLGKWDLEKGTGVKFPERGSFSRESVAFNVKNLRALVRGSLTAKQRKLMGPTTKPPKGTRVAGAVGAAVINAYTATGYRKWPLK